MKSTNQDSVAVSSPILLVQFDNNEGSACEINCGEFGYSGCSGDCSCDGD